MMGNYERNLGPHIREESLPSPSFWSYIASPGNAGGRDLAQMIKKHHGDKVEIRPLSRPDASGTSSAKGGADARLLTDALLA